MECPVKTLLVHLLSILLLAVGASAATIVSVANLPVPGSVGTADLLQTTGALAGPVQGTGTSNPARSETRTFYYWGPDGASTTPTFMGGNWPVVFIEGSLVVDPGISASVTAGALQNTGLLDELENPIQASPLLINGSPVYQFSFDPTTTTTAGIYGPWYGVSRTGSAVIPEPATALPLAAGLGIFAALRRRGER